MNAFDDYNDRSYYDDQDPNPDNISPVEDEFMDYLYKDDLSSQDKYIYEVSQSLYIKCVSLYNPDYKNQTNIQEDRYYDLSWDSFPYAEISAKYPHTYNQILVHLIEASNNRRDRRAPNNTIYGYGIGDWNTNDIRITTPQIVAVVEILAKHANLVVRGVQIQGMAQLLLDYAITFGNISLLNILDKQRGDAIDQVNYVFKTCRDYLLNYMSRIPEFTDGFELHTIENARIRIAKSIFPHTKPLFQGLYMSYVCRQFIAALNGGLYLIAEFILCECRKHQIDVFTEPNMLEIEHAYIDACNKGNADVIRIYCKFDPYKYSVNPLPVLQCDSSGHTENSFAMISNTHYGIIYSPKNKKWQYMRILLQALHYTNTISLPIDIVREISSF